MSLSVVEWDRFIRDRRAGKLRPKGQHHGRGVRDRQVAYDLKVLRAAVRWAMQAKDGRAPLLEGNPLEGLPLPNEASPRRPVLDDDRYHDISGVAARVSAQFALALVLCHETGHRLRSVRLLRWSDVDLESGVVRWRGENDKIGFEHTTMLTDEARTALMAARAQAKTIGDAWIFPAALQPGEPTSRSTFAKWWRQAETLAKVPRVERCGWHSLRRKFATELKGTPLKDLCYLGGWRRESTVLTCYQTHDEATMREALAGRRPLRAQASR